VIGDGFEAVLRAAQGERRGVFAAVARWQPGAAEPVTHTLGRSRTGDIELADLK
jgi:hypothetical protein